MNNLISLNFTEFNKPTPTTPQLKRSSSKLGVSSKENPSKSLIPSWSNSKLNTEFMLNRSRSYQKISEYPGIHEAGSCTKRPFRTTSSILTRPTTIRRKDKTRKINWVESDQENFPVNDIKSNKTEIQNELLQVQDDMDELFSCNLETCFNSPSFETLAQDSGKNCVLSGEIFGTKKVRSRSPVPSRSRSTSILKRKAYSNNASPRRSFKELSDSVPQRSLSKTFPKSTSTLPVSVEEDFMNMLREETMSNLDENVNTVMLKNGDPDNPIIESFSPWIQKAFQMELSKIHTNAEEHLANRIQEIERNNKLDMIKIQRAYRDRLFDLEASSEKFQEWFDVARDENRRLKEEKGALLLEIKNLKMEQKLVLDSEIDKRLDQTQSKHEAEKEQLNDKHTQEIHSINEKCETRVKLMETQFQQEVDSLKSLIEELKSQNKLLTENMEKPKDELDFSPFPINRERMMNHIQDLREQLASSEHEKTLVLLAHNDEVSALHKELNQLHEQMNEQFRSYNIATENLKKQHEDNMTEMQERLSLKDKEYRSSVNLLRNKFGTQISELTQTIVGIQKQVIVDEIENNDDDVEL